ncbi:MAG TPA: hypothetical protein VEK84_12425 [Terriglobales bacterium]|nr:hypothetical protein [Terriglobales bacterium]
MDKDFPIHERLGIQFRSEFLNVLNHPNFGLPNNTISFDPQTGRTIGSPGAGTIRTVVTNARQIQFALRMHW